MLQMLKNVELLMIRSKNWIFITFLLSFSYFSLLDTVGDRHQLHMCNVNLVMSCVQFHSYHHISSL